MKFTVIPLSRQKKNPGASGFLVGRPVRLSFSTLLSTENPEEPKTLLKDENGTRKTANELFTCFWGEQNDPAGELCGGVT
jgi:hypothetical protein